MNLDVAFAQTSGAEPNLRITSTQGFDGFGVATNALFPARSARFRDGDLDSGNDWQFSRSPDLVRWNNGASTDTSLGWGMLYSFSFVSTSPPVVGEATLYADTAPVPQSFVVQTLVPGS